MNLRIFAAVCGLLLFSLASGFGAEKISLGEGVIIIETSAGGKLTMAYPVLVNAAKVKVKVTEKTGSGGHTLLKFEGGGTLDLAASGTELNIKLVEIPAGTRFLYSSMNFDSTYAGGKWKAGGKEGNIAKEKPAQPTLFQGNTNGLSITDAAGTAVSLRFPDNTYEQLQDGRAFNSPNILFQFWALYQPGMDRCTISLGAAPASSSTATATVPVAPEPKLSTAEGTELLKWKDGKRACFMLAFDDSAPSQLKNVVPELEKRKIVGTFYLVTGHSLWDNLKTKWTEAAQNPYIVVANHTFTHKGVENAVQLEEELRKCNEVLYAIHPEQKMPRLLGFGTPGGVPWKVTKEELAEALKRNHLADRPLFAGSPMHYKSIPEVIAVVDAAIDKGEMGHLDFHGVGGDWLVTPLDWFTALLDKLEASRDQLWITDTVSWHQYVTERKNTAVTSLENDAQAIRLGVSCSLDPALYDLPLTFSTKVPAGWANCAVHQGSANTTAPVKNGIAQYSALPGGGEITLKKAQ